MKIALALFVLLAAGPAHPPTPPIPTKDWTVVLHDDVDSSALQLACQRIGPKELQCVDLTWLLEARERMKEHQAEIDDRKETQRRAWGCGQNTPSVDCTGTPDTRINL